MAKDHKRNDNYTKKVLVCCVGLQPHSNIWVFSKDLQIDDSGNVIPFAQHKFFWSVTVVWYTVYTKKCTSRTEFSVTCGMIDNEQPKDGKTYIEMLIDQCIVCID
jgi:hypothetical protein